ncbi:hypothetical protein EDD15DRAFT_402762 [Pisolithus albus]|nr:hypothetical protein EDD15DRAFT_402762 [Pisolithus albus]
MVHRAIVRPAGIPWPGCMLSESLNTALTLPAWITAMLVATIFLGLTLRLLYSSMKLRFRRFDDFTISNIRGEIRNIQPITQTLVRDSVLIYFPMFGILVASVPIMAVYKTFVGAVTVPIISALYSFCASRLIIHTRESLSRLSPDVQSRETGSIIYASQSLKAPPAWMRT